MNMKKSLLFYLIAFLLTFFSNADAEFGLGVNLVDDGAFVNMMNHTNRFSNASGYDELGWPLSDFDLVLMDGRPVAEWNGEIDDPEHYRVDYSGIYKCSFKGLADVNAWGTSVELINKLYVPENNTTYFELNVGGYPNDNHGLVFLDFTNTQRTSDSELSTGITNLKVMRPGYELNTTQTFTNEFIALCKAADFACYRFYNVQNIWDGEPVFPDITPWEKRKTPLDATQSEMTQLNGKKDGWCWEYIIELANILDKDIWICLHISCDSNYVANLANMLKNNLKSNIKIYVENSNEVWSEQQATHGPYNHAQAEFYNLSFMENYARRTVELSNWFAKVFGKNEINKRIRVILAGQQVWPGRNESHLQYIQSHFDEPNKFIYAISTALYFQSTNAESTDPVEINQGMTAEINDQTNNPENSFYRKNHTNLANQWGLIGGCTSYEGGAHLPAGGGTDNLAAQILAHRTIEMKGVMKLNYLEGWKNIGGGLALVFTLASSYTRYGCWGLTDDVKYPDRNYKMQAARDIIGSYTAIEETEINNELNLIYPNPASDFIEISLKRCPTSSRCRTSEDICIFNSYGEKVLSEKAVPANSKQRISISNLPAGVYYMKIGNLVEKFIVVR